LLFGRLNRFLFFFFLFFLLLNSDQISIFDAVDEGKTLFIILKYLVGVVVSDSEFLALPNLLFRHQATFGHINDKLVTDFDMLFDSFVANR
jgi:hypothetical protein